MDATCLKTLVVNSAQGCLCSEVLTEPWQRAPERGSHYFKPLRSEGSVVIEGSSWGHFLKTLSALTGGRGKEDPKHFCSRSQGQEGKSQPMGSGQLEGKGGSFGSEHLRGSLAQSHLALSPLLHIWNQQAAEVSTSKPTS